MTRRARPYQFKLEDLRDGPKGRKDWRWVFLNTLIVTGSVTKSCLKAKVSRDTAYRHRSQFPRFRKRWDQALEVCTDLLEGEVYERALDREDRNSHLLLMFKLKSLKPELYRDVHIPRVAAVDEETIDSNAAAAALRAASESHATRKPSGDPEHAASDA
jgi:hypothetical protein